MKTPLYDWHKQHGGKIVDFAGWQMPVYYTSLMEEHKTVRTKAGLFDVSHMGEFLLEGPKAESFLQFVTTNDVSKLKNGTSQYSLLLNEGGTVVDDIIVYRFSPTKFLLCVNAGNTPKDFAWVKTQADSFGGVTLTNRSDHYGLIALQGPASLPIMKSLSLIDPETINRFSFIETGLAEIPVILSRTGYTGEDGFEIFCPWEKTEVLWTALMKEGQGYGLIPIGLGARDTLRLEMKYSLYGHEINDSTNPLEAGLGWTVKIDKGNFIGREALIKIKEAGLSRQLVCLELEETGVPREGYLLYPPEGDSLPSIGKVTSGTFSPSLEKGIAIAYVNKPHTEPGTFICVKIRKDLKKARVVKAPFYKPS